MPLSKEWVRPVTEGPRESVALIEAHGTGTRIGDQVEFSSLKKVFGHRNAFTKTCALGSVKSMIGHTTAAAGAAGLIKAAFALHHKVILPTLKADPPDPKLEIEASPFYISRDSRPWFSHTDHPRRAGVSSFGFGGSNFHVVLEEHQKDKQAVSWDGAVEIFPLSADEPSQLSARLIELKARIAKETSFFQPSRMAAELRRTFTPVQPFRLIFIHDQSEEKPDTAAESLVQLLDRALQALEKKGTDAAWHQKDIFFGCSTKPAQVAFLFPGQGSQYAGMGKDLACTFPEMMRILEKLNERVLLNHGNLTDLIFPLPSADSALHQAYEKALQPTEIAQPAIGGISLGMANILKKFGIKPDAVCGHSFGELSALCAAGWMDENSLIDLAVARGKAMAEASGAGTQGAMIAVRAPLDTLSTFAEKFPEVTLANLNSPDQGVLSGPKAAIHQAQQTLKSKGFRSTRLPVSAAFHSHRMKPAAAAFQAVLKRYPLTPGGIPVLSNSTGSVYPADPDPARKILENHLLKPVMFKADIEHLFQQGIELFLEVGPKSVLTGLVRAILKTDKIHALSVDASAGNDFGIADLARTLALAASLGNPVRFDVWEDSVPKKTHPRMQIAICGANYRTPSKNSPEVSVAVPPYRNQNENSAAAESKPMEAPPEQPSRSSSTASAATSHSEQQPFQNTKMTKPSMKPEKIKKNPPPPADPWIPHAIKMVQEGLAAMQALQAQTTEAHKKFLETQAEASRTLQQMMESARRLSDPSLDRSHNLLKSGASFEMPAAAVRDKAGTEPRVNQQVHENAVPAPVHAADHRPGIEESLTASVPPPADKRTEPAFESLEGS
ncbi:MAG: acyltransferase domain-containing protein, partial [Deltaproteobacteria bacterium]